MSRQLPEQPIGLTWRPGRSAAEQSALMREHAGCLTCLDERKVVVGWVPNGGVGLGKDAVWGPCPDCGDNSC